MKRNDLRKELWKVMGIPKKDALSIIGVILNTIVEAIVRGETVHLDNLGRFEVRSWKARGRRPQYLQTSRGTITVNSGKPQDTVTIKFVPVHDLRYRVKASYLAGNFKPKPRSLHGQHKLNQARKLYRMQQERLEKKNASQKSLSS